jgi:Sec-independent protein translocase protein TatA
MAGLGWKEVVIVIVVAIVIIGVVKLRNRTS